MGVVVDDVLEFEMNVVSKSHVRVYDRRAGTGIQIAVRQTEFPSLCSAITSPYEPEAFVLFAEMMHPGRKQ